MGILRNWSRSYNAWVTMLDEHRKPNCGPHAASATIIELKDDLTVECRYDYYMYGHFMKFIQRGAVRIESTMPDIRNFANVVFRTPDGGFVMVVANGSRKSLDFAVKCLGQSFSATLPATSIATYQWQP